MMKIDFFKILLVSSLLLSLQACFVADKYVRPEGIVDPEYFRTDRLSQDSISMAEVSWRELFTDPLLERHIEQALRQNIDIRIALQQIDAAEAYLSRAKAGYYPTVFAGLSAVHQENPSGSRTLPGSFDQFELSADLSWEADIWGKIKSNERAQNAAFLQSVAAHKAVKTELVAGVATLYYQLLALDEQMETTLETVANRTSSQETIEALKEAGIVSEVGVKQSEAQLLRARAVVVDLENEIRLTENALSILMGDPPHPIERTDLDQQQITTPLSLGVPLLLLRNRPDIIAAEYNLIEAFQLRNVAKSNFYPSLRLSATAGFQSLDLADLLNTNALFASMAGSLTQPIFNRREIKTQYEVAKAQQEIAFLNFKRAILEASQEVSDALANYAAVEKKLQIKAAELEAYRLATEYSEELLSNGMANYLEVLTARESVLNTQLELINLRFSELSTLVDLYQALGGGWK